MEKNSISNLSVIVENFKMEYEQIEQKFYSTIAKAENWIPDLKETEIRTAKNSYSKNIAELKSRYFEKVEMEKVKITSEVSSLFLSPIPDNALNIIASMESIPVTELGRVEVIEFARKFPGYPLLKRRIAALAKEIGIDDPELTYTVRMDAIIADLEDLCQSITSSFESFGMFEPTGTSDLQFAMRRQHVSEAIKTLTESLDRLAN